MKVFIQEATLQGEQKDFCLRCWAVPFMIIIESYLARIEARSLLSSSEEEITLYWLMVVVVVSEGLAYHTLPVPNPYPHHSPSCLTAGLYNISNGISKQSCNR